jgi:hypothetical protein
MTKSKLQWSNVTSDILFEMMDEIEQELWYRIQSGTIVTKDINTIDDK